MADEAMFCVLVVTDALPNGQQHYQVEARRDWSLLTLLKKLPSNVVNAISRDPDLYTVNNPLPSDDLQAISRASLESDETKYTKISSEKYVRNIGKDFLADHIYLVILDEVDGSASAVNKLAQNHPELFKCLTINVEAELYWTKDDVKLNGGIYLEDEKDRKPPQMLDLETRLRRRRLFTPENDDPKLSLARSLRSFESTYAPCTQSQDGETIKNSSEFLAFYNMLYCYVPDALRYLAAGSLSLKTTAMKSNFIIPPFFSGRDIANQLAYHEEAPWEFPLFVQCEDMGSLPRKYIPKNDFCVSFRQYDLPFVIGEVPSEKDGKRSRHRMLLHGIALARLVFALRKPGISTCPFIVGIYLTEHLVAERYIMMKVQSDSDEVFISHKDFDLSRNADAIDFQREMYNLASVLESISQNVLNPSKCEKVEAMKEDAAGMKSLRTTGAWTEERTTDTISGEYPRGYSPFDVEEDLGIFDEENVRAALRRMNYEVAYVAFGYPHLAPVTSRRDGKIVGCLKFVNDEDGGREIEILQYLANLPSESNHTIRPFGIWPVTGGTIIGMPPGGDHLAALKDPDAHLLSVTTQLFEAVKFMHDHNVAHMDLKPFNILFSPDHDRLTIIDFETSVLLKSKTARYSGRVGTEGYMAPEVAHSKYSPVSADLWTVGRVVLDLCLRCRPSPTRQALLALSGRLLDDDPKKRPSMSEVLNESRDIAKT